MRLIDADELKKDFDNLHLFKLWVREEIKAHIDNAPTIDAIVNTIEVRPRGEWILEEEDCDNRGNNFYQCSNCFYHDTHCDTAIVPYCWHCGAEMLKGGKEE